MTKVAGNQHLQRRNSVYYYRRRVPHHLVKAIGKQFIQHSLKTTSLAKAKKLRAVRDLEWDARFEDLEKKAAPGSKSSNSKATVKSSPLSEGDLLQLFREYVERTDAEFAKRLANNPPESKRERAEMSQDWGLDAQIIRDRDDPQADQLIYHAGNEILQTVGKSSL
jgi:hypothetical protein